MMSVLLSQLTAITAPTGGVALERLERLELRSTPSVEPHNSCCQIPAKSLNCLQFQPT